MISKVYYNLNAITIITIIKGSLTFLHFRMNCHHGGNKTQHQVKTDKELIGLTARWLEKKRKKITIKLLLLTILIFK